MRLTELLAPDGSKIYIQYDEEDMEDDLRAVGYIEDIAERTKKFKETMVSTVRSYSETLLNAVQEGMTGLAPDKVALEFGLQLGGEAGVPFVTKGTAQANVKVTIEWSLNREKQV